MATVFGVKDAFFARLNPDTNEYEAIAPLKSPALINFTPREDNPKFEPIDLSRVLSSYTITVKIPYSFWWRDKWARGFNKAVSINPIPSNNPRDN
jgi:hypothetical protein